MAFEVRGGYGRCHVGSAREGEAYVCVFECTSCDTRARQLAGMPAVCGETRWRGVRAVRTDRA